MHPIAARLLDWYARSGRDLPWRREVSPYRTLLSEAMLQQTRVETVLPYFASFTARWPTVQDLAAAEDEEVLGAWAGLGYYRRARALHAAARQIAARGGFPETLEGLRTLAGVGPYSAAAIGSIAFGLDALALDGNLVRVGARLGAVAKPVDAGAGRADVEELLGALLPPGRAGDFNQALMDLGATVCVPREPRCGVCPIVQDCRAYAAGTQTELPLRRPRKEPQAVRAVALVTHASAGVLLTRRPEGGLLGGLWGPPMTELTPGEDVEAGLARLLALAGPLCTAPTPCGDVSHVFTHQRWQVVVFAAELAPGRKPRTSDERMAMPGSEEAPPLSRLAEKVLEGGVRH